MSYTVATLLCSVPQSAPPNLIKNAKKVPFKHACISSSARPAYLCFSQTFTKERRSLSEDASHAAAASEHMVNYEAGKKKKERKKKSKANMKEKQMSTFFKKVFDTDVAALAASVHKPLSLALSPSLPPSLSPCC